MLWTLFVILLVAWAVGLITANTMGGFIHLLLLAAVVVLLLNVIQRRTPA
ncbi:MAG: lmo0937 family membrane protein [Pseudomonadota bacterium]|nr:lmo0937 family membrane protein [Pseudomonadota bacterium]